MTIRIKVHERQTHEHRLAFIQLGASLPVFCHHFLSVQRKRKRASPVFFASASLMVMKFFRDLDILQPAMVR